MTTINIMDVVQGAVTGENYSAKAHDGWDYHAPSGLTHFLLVHFRLKQVID